MKYVLSRYNHDLSWLAEYSNDYIIYDRSERRINLDNVLAVPNIGSDIYDKLTFIIDNYNNLPDVAVYTKANLFKYITKEEWGRICNNTTFTPILTQNHKEVICDEGLCKAINVPVGTFYSYYKDGMYHELNYPSYLKTHKLKDQPEKISLEWFYNLEICKLVGMDKMEYIPFAPGSGYILPKENILKHPKEFYIKLRSFLDWSVYPAEAMILERGLYNIWK